jgi:hypothetical protein
MSQPTDAELQEFWDESIAKWKAGLAEHPLAHHPLAVRCDGAEGCYTVAPIRILPDYTKRYCPDHLPTETEAQQIRQRARKASGSNELR